MKWYEAQNVDELKAIGNFNIVKREINRDIKRITGKSRLDGFIKMGSNSWKGQFEKILSLKKIISEFNNVGQAPYFKSESDRYIFCLLELSGEERMKQLKMYKSLYINKDEASKWYKEIAKNIHPDTCKNEKASEAMAELTSIYNTMVEHE